MTARIDVEGAEQASVGTDAVWVIGPDAVVRVDLDGLSTSVIAPGTGVDQDSAIWASAQGVWTRTSKQFTTRIDPQTRLVVERIESDLNDVGDIVGFDGSLWVSAGNNDFVVHFEAGPR